MKLPLPVSTYKLDATQASARRLVNCYIEQVDGKGPVLLRRSPGIRPWGEAGTRGRGLHTDSRTGILYAASGNQLYRVPASGVAESLGAITGSGMVSMDNNVDSLVVVTNPDAFYYNGTFGQITDPDFTDRGASQTVFLGNWMIFLEPGSGRQFGADFGTVTNFDALNFATAEGSPDNTKQLLSDKQQLVQLGTGSTEIAYNSGRSGYPFERLPSGGDFNLGTPAGFSGALADNTFGFLASDLTARMLRGVTPTRISTHAIEEAIKSITSREDALGLAFTLNGHLFYALNFPAGERTFIYDVTTQQWHETGSYYQKNWQVVSVASAYGKILVQDGATGRIGELDQKYFAHWDEPQVMSWTYQSVYSDNLTAFHDRLEIIGTKGVGLLTGQGSDPQIMLEISDDGGKTFRSYTSRSLGAIGEYKWRVYWDRLGSSKDRVYRCSVSDPVEVTIMDTQLYTRGGRV